MKVLLVPTTPGWAFDNRARDLMTARMRSVRCEIKYMADVRSADQDHYDLIYPMTLDGARLLHERQGIALEKMAAGVTSLRSLEQHLLGERRFSPAFLRYIRQLKGINCMSNEILRLFAGQSRIIKTRVGIDTELFRPRERRGVVGGFRVGWVGRIDKPVYRQHKGYDQVLKALNGLGVELDIRTYKEHYVPRKEMVSFYQGLDCYICSSRSEGLPNPVLEAAACGVPIISTNVGIVPELIRHRHNGLIVSGSADSIREAVCFLMNEPDERRRYAQRIRQTIESKWTWAHCARDWETFFRIIQRER
ncbi:hypothetical protein PA598K_06806 [Paenibacillus sp. 598K]|uniref:glycosyltransferase family 4 protein n=1 Tax=Paenibacillus sp. 598K TaxID=1117987 RepID=UPI000FFAE4EB|nr:glycosyltransferase family 4 protein [Paenibacillus sp. 598K]GBF78195.1 hypothetical protein PA598K_06806 [Paenibacillus sp. 598K]